MNFESGAQLLELCGEDKTISQVMIEREQTQVGGSREEIQARMAQAYGIMKEAVRSSLESPARSMGGLIGGEAARMIARSKEHKPVCGGITAKAVAYAMGVLEVNASMGVIVAAPTAGSSGVIPGVFLAVQEAFDFGEQDILDALFNAAAIGYLVTANATVAGAEGGCQAEVGTASAMAASGVIQLMGGTPKQCLDGAATALSNLMGLVCDPVGGLVEAPCQKRNAIGASNALVSAEITLSGVPSLIPFDETVDAMYRVGLGMPRELRETALGGIAATPTACRMCTR